MAEATIRDVEYLFRRIHPTASVSEDAYVGTSAEWIGHPSKYPASIEQNAIVREGARVHAGTYRETVVGAGSLVLSGAYVGHDVVLGEGVQVSPNAAIGGCCTIGDGAKVGMNASIVQKLTIGRNAIIGAGAVVTKDVPEGETWVGNPAKPIRRRAVKPL